MRKVFFSFLGTNDYLFCNYDFKQDEAIQNVRFIQEACIRHHCKDWTENDRVFIFMTDEARKMNWEDGGHERNPQPGLRSILNSLHMTPRVEDISIPSGKSVEEIWEIFDLVFRHFEKNDRLFLDITHAFRSIPMLAMVILSYAKVMREIQVNAISYGAMEVLGPYQEVKQLPVEERNVPVFDLLPFSSLQDWVSAVDQFTTTGNGTKIGNLAEKEMRIVLKESRGQNQEAQFLRRVGNNLADFTSNISTCRSRKIPESAVLLKANLENIWEQNLIKPLKPLLQERLKPILAPFTGNEIKDGLAAARWCLEHGLYQQGYTILLETLFTYVLREGAKLEGKEEKERNLVGSAFARIRKKDKNIRTEDETLSYAFDNMVQWLENEKELFKIMSGLIEIRNDLNHAGQKVGAKSPDKICDSLEVYIETAEHLISRDSIPSFEDPERNSF